MGQSLNPNGSGRSGLCELYDAGGPVHPEHCCKPHFLSCLLGPSHHLKPHLKSHRKDEKFNSHCNVKSYAEDELSLKFLQFYLLLPSTERAT